MFRKLLVTTAAILVAVTLAYAADNYRLNTAGGTVTKFKTTETGGVHVPHFNIDSGGGSGGTASTFGAAFPASGTAVGMSQGGNMVPITGTSDNLNVNCASGCAGGTFNNNADNVATSSTNGQSAAWNYVWDGSAWDRLYGDSTNGAFVNVKAVPADPFGVNADAASATGSISAKLRFIASTGIPITGTVTVGSHAVTNAGTFATQAAQSGTWNVTNISGTVSLPTGAATAAKQPALGTAGASSTDVISVQGIASGTAMPVSVASIPSHAVTNAGTFAVQANGFTSWAGSTLGAMANYGTSPGAVAVPGVNAFVTNTLAAQGTNADAVAAAATSASPVLGYNMVYNGTTWDRAPGAAATGTKTSQSSPYPLGAVPYTATATGTTGATTATLAGAASVTTYICGYSIRANATAAATGNATVTGVISATMNFTQWTAPNASGLGINEQIFSPCIPASGTNQSIAVVSAAPGTGGVVSVTAWGYKL